jgi:exodeoxyribonuclease V alpha subunit
MNPSAIAHPAFAEIDRWFADLISRLSPESSPEVQLAAALTSYQRNQGHTCLDLARFAGTTFPAEADHDAAEPIRMPVLEKWVSALNHSSAVGRPGDFRPLIFDGRHRLYLHRYWTYESQLAKAVLRRARDGGTCDATRLDEGLRRFFGEARGTESEEVRGEKGEASAVALTSAFPLRTSPVQSPAWGQRHAVATAVRHRFCVISGGPGTGKTRTVAIVLALLLEQAGANPLRIALAAPTGKAAARLQESIKGLKDSLPCTEAVKGQLPIEAFTLHRLLGTRPDSVECRFNAENPLPFDLVVVDEASMVDLALMAKLFAATPLHARLVLLGDKDQLASVETGSVLADICAGAQGPPPARPGLPSVSSTERSGLSDCVVQLEKNYRFGAHSGLLALSRAIHDDDAEGVLRLLQTPPLFREKKAAVTTSRSSISLPANPREGIASASLPPPPELKERLRRRVLDGFGTGLRSRQPLEALRALNQFRILCAVRKGPFGVEALNRCVEEILNDARLIRPQERWYAGRQVMVTRNDPDLRLFNGDVGVILPDASSGDLRAWFLGMNNEPRSVSPSRLPEHETAFAMTVHKSQGSEFDEVLFILPDRESPVLSRELLYTGVTRASRHLELWFHEPILRAAVANRVERMSGLREALWEAGPVNQ